MKTLFIDGADRAICGMVERCGQVPIVIYDHKKLVSHFIKKGMSHDESQEWIDFNILGAWLGEGTPGIMFSGNSKSIRDQLND